ncbi:MAG: hypothetical protein K0Q62_40 [Phenylobacterium sp.]|nr:hypothetical protein [Phenylobacterium sp.]
MRRSKSLVLTSLMATGGLSLSACDAGRPQESAWLSSPPAASPPGPAEGQYPTLKACQEADVVADLECDQAFARAEAEAPRYADRQTCEANYGVDQCVPRSQAGAGSLFMPLLTGFIVGQALNSFGSHGYYGTQYSRRDEAYGSSGGYAGGYGGGYGGGRDYVSGRANSGLDAPARVQSRSAVTSRGGFGGGGRGYGG